MQEDAREQAWSRQDGQPELEWPWARARDEFQEAMEAGYGSNFASTVLRGWNKDTLGGYMRQIKRLAYATRRRAESGSGVQAAGHRAD